MFIDVPSKPSSHWMWRNEYFYARTQKSNFLFIKVPVVQMHDYFLNSWSLLDIICITRKLDIYFPGKKIEGRYWWVGSEPYQAYIAEEHAPELPCERHNVCVSGRFSWYRVGPGQRLSDHEPKCQWTIPPKDPNIFINFSSINTILTTHYIIILTTRPIGTWMIKQTEIRFRR